MIDEEALAAALLDAQDRAAALPPLTSWQPDLDVAAAYRVLARYESTRIAQGWRPVGRKIGFTNRTIWARYGVDRPMWARVWAHTVKHARDGRVTLSMAGLVQPRIEPEVVFGLASPPPASGDARSMLASVAWIARGFEIVQSPFPDWKFAVPDCTAAYGLHGALAVGEPVVLDERARDSLASVLGTFSVTLMRDGQGVDRGGGANVLDGPPLALQHLARVLASQPEAPPLAAGEIVTTGTLTDAWPVAAGQSWTADYGALALPSLELRIA